MQAKRPKVSIIIVNWNGLQDTIECLESLKGITYSNYEAIVVDNGSDGDDADILLKKFGDYIHVIENDKNYGFTGGNNIGIRYALKKNADYIMLLNNDTIVAPDFLSKLVEVAANNPNTGLLGPKIYLYSEPNKIWFAGGKISFLSTHSNRGYMAIDRGQFDEMESVDFLSGSCMLIKRSVLESAGLLDPIFFFSFEDTDLSLRSIQEGFTNVYVPSSKIWHKVFSSGRRNPDITYYTSRNAMIFARKHFRAFKTASLRAVSGVITELVFYTVRNRNARILRTMIQGLRDGLTIDLESSKAGRVV